MSAGPSDLVAQGIGHAISRTAQPLVGLAPPQQALPGVLGGQPQTNTGAAQFLGGPLTQNDYKVGPPAYVPSPQDDFNPVRGPGRGPDGFPIGVQGNYRRGAGPVSMLPPNLPGGAPGDPRMPIDRFARAGLLNRGVY